MTIPMQGDEYTPVSLFSIPVDEQLPFTIWVYFQGQFIVYRNKGQVFETTRYNRFIFKRISKLYIAARELESYREFVKGRQVLEERKINDPKLTAEQRTTLTTVRSLDEVTKELFASSDEEIAEATTKVVGVAKETVQRICERPYLRIFESIPNSSSVVDHSMRVSLLATFLGYQLGFVNPLALEHLAAAGLLHDIGKTRVATGDELELSPEQEAEIERKHPTMSVETLKKIPLVPEEVLHIIGEHHERRDGTGYPAAMRGRQMHGLSKVFAIANTFDNLVSELQGDREARYKAAGAKMEREMRAWFEPLLLPKAVRLLTHPG